MARRRQPPPPTGAGGRSGLRRGSFLGQYVGFVPALVLFGLFFAAPLGLIVAYSFWKVVDYNVVHDWTLDNYRYFFSVSTVRPDAVGDDLGGLRRDGVDDRRSRSRSRTGSSATSRSGCSGCCSCS